MMSPKKNNTKHTANDEADLWRVVLLFGPLVVLVLVTPLIYRATMKLIEQDHHEPINANLTAGVVTFILSALSMLILQSYGKHLAHHFVKSHHQHLTAFQHHKQRMPAFLIKVISLFDGSNGSDAQASSSKSNNSFAFSSASEQTKGSDDDTTSKRKIDPKYFKPKFILSELVTFWDTTCTVITWGSFYVIGGTIVATEKIAHRIKTKSSRSSNIWDSSFIFTQNSTANQNGRNRGTGQSASSSSSAFGRSSTQSGNNNTATPDAQQQANQRQPFKRISSWTKRSVTTIKKKFSRVTRSRAPQLTSGPANESSSSLFFFTSGAASPQ